MGELGQVFTSERIARLMAQILVDDIDASVKNVLDPCIGPNVFLKQVNRLNSALCLHGIEIDESLITEDTRKFYELNGRELQIGNFFDFASQTKKSFDLIIENPPYVRHEKMTDENDKQQIRSFFKDKSYKIPAKSNLYVYFLLQSIDMLKDGGKLVAVVYDSWLYSQYGESFKKNLSNLGSIDSVIHFKDGAFDDAGIGATIIEFVKGVRQSEVLRFATYDNAENISNLSRVKWTKKPYADLTEVSSKPESSDSSFIALGDVAEINRGTSALNNKLFVFKEKQFEETIPFLKSVKDLNSMSANGDKHLLVVRNKYKSETQAYLDKIRDIILDNDNKYQTLSKRVRTEKLWYSPRLAKTGDIIFNYYLRDTLDFILNINRLQSSDNFYNLRFQDHIYAHFALLNSTRVRQAVFNKARTQGSGLKKIQLYEFRSVMIPNLHKFSTDTICNLEKLGKRLAVQERISDKKRSIITSVDKLIDLELMGTQKSHSIDYTGKEYGKALV